MSTEATSEPKAPPESNAGAFSYFNGERVVHGDPLRLQRVLYMAVGMPARGPDELFAAYHSQDRARWMPAVGLVVEAVRTAFDMVPFDAATGRGATEEDCRAAVEALWEYLALKKNRRAGWRTSSGPTTSTPCSSPLRNASG